MPGRRYTNYGDLVKRRPCKDMVPSKCKDTNYCDYNEENDECTEPCQEKRKAYNSITNNNEKEDAMNQWKSCIMNHRLGENICKTKASKLCMHNMHMQGESIASRLADDLRSMHGGGKGDDNSTFYQKGDIIYEKGSSGCRDPCSDKRTEYNKCRRAGGYGKVCNSERSAFEECAKSENTAFPPRSLINITKANRDRRSKYSTMTQVPDRTYSGFDSSESSPTQKKWLQVVKDSTPQVLKDSTPKRPMTDEFYSAVKEKFMPSGEMFNEFKKIIEKSSLMF